MLAALPVFAFPLLMIVAAVKDLATMTIPNWISLGLIGAFLVIAPFTLPPAEMGVHLLVGVGALAIGFTMFALGWVGGGDAKLLAGAALWAGWGALPEFLIWTGIAGGVFSVVLIGARRAVVLLPVAVGRGPLGRLLEPEGDMPYGVALCVGGLMAFPETTIFLSTIGAAG